MPPARGFAILTCMDARLDPAKYAGLSEGDAHVIRNAGGRASDDALPVPVGKWASLVWLAVFLALLAGALGFAAVVKIFGLGWGIW